MLYLYLVKVISCYIKLCSHMPNQTGAAKDLRSELGPTFESHYISYCLKLVRIPCFYDLWYETGARLCANKPNRQGLELLDPAKVDKAPTASTIKSANTGRLRQARSLIDAHIPDFKIIHTIGRTHLLLEGSVISAMVVMCGER